MAQGDSDYFKNRTMQIVVIGAHPDDADLMTGGTAIKYSRLGHKILFVSCTNGDAGHFKMGGGTLAKIRSGEAQEAAKRLGVTYKVLENHDGELMPEIHIRFQIIRLIREWEADIIITHRPNDYHPDHRNTSILVQGAAYMVVVPNIMPDIPALKKNPVFLFAQDHFQRPYPFQPEISVDISDVYDEKIYAMSAHKSQFFEWIPWVEGYSDKVPHDEHKRLEWLGKIWKTQITSDIRQSLTKWYGKEKAEKITDAEAFEVCEYGRRPTDSEIRKLFPMIGS
jgi:LmbE family N-acetylglucosaminyl deacetylase